MKNRRLWNAGTSLMVALISGLACGLASGIDFNTLETRGAKRTYSARTSAVSSHTVTGILLSYSVSAVGGTLDFEIKHSTISSINLSSTTQSSNLDVNKSSTIYVLSGQSLSDDAKAMVVNPLIYVIRIDAATTGYIDIDYIAPRTPDAF